MYSIKQFHQYLCFDFLIVMTNSEVILSTYKEIVNCLDQPYYILEGLSGSSGDNQIIHSSPSIKQLTGFSQFDLARNSKIFFDSIHPDYIQSYIESNKRLIDGAQFDSRKYLIKHQITGEYVPVEELATSRLNTDKNYFEIYCTVKKPEQAIIQCSDGNAVAPNEQQESFKKLIEGANYFVNRMSQHFKMSAVRLYSYDHNTNILQNIADSQNKRYQNRLESLTGAKINSLVPAYNNESLFYQLMNTQKGHILDDQKSIIEIIKCHTDSTILKKMATAAVKIYRVKSFGLLPIICPNGNTVGVVTFGAPKHYSDKGKQIIFEYCNTNSFILTPLLCSSLSHPVGA